MSFEDAWRTRRPALSRPLTSNFNFTRNGIRYTIYVVVTLKNNFAVASIRIVQYDKPKDAIFKRIKACSNWDSLLQWYKNVTYNVFQN